MPRHLRQRSARYCLLFVSEHYAGKVWTNHERKSAQARALQENEEYILPVRLDGTEIPGLRPTIGFIDIRVTTVDELVDLVLQKLRRSSGQVVAAEPIRVPRTTKQQRRLLAERPPGWEYQLFAGVLLQGRAALEPKWRDHQLRYVRTSGPALSRDQISSYIPATLREVSSFASNIERVTDAGARSRAFGPPGIPGDPTEIEHLGQRVVEIYEGFLDWSARIRGTPVPGDHRRLFELLASFADNPIREMQAFMDHTVYELDRLPERLASDGDEPIEIMTYIDCTIDKNVSKEFDREMKRLRRRGCLLG